MLLFTAALFFIFGYEANAIDDDVVPLFFPKPTQSTNDIHYNPKHQQYPQFSHIPVTSFSCQSYPFSGFFADMLTGCQVYHRCEDDGRRSSYLCPNQTIFNQQTLVCDWWYNVECSTSGQHYHVNYEKFSSPVQVSLPYRSPPLPANRQNVTPQYGSRPHRVNNNNQNNYEYSRFGAKRLLNTGVTHYVPKFHPTPSPPPRPFFNGHNRPQIPEKLQFNVRHFNLPPIPNSRNNIRKNPNVYIVTREGHDAYSALQYGSNNLYNRPPRKA
ncbi:hypothetical protein CHUAL_007814 [Chamberlinius hualienensis]